ncbi:MAG: efflux RND transporter permease subunit, partial [Candidatus Binatia bacterium]
PDLAVDKAFADRIHEKLVLLPSLRDVQFAQTLDYPSVEVRIDRERAGLLGVHVDDVARSLVAATASSRFTVANFWADPVSGVSYNVQVQVPQPQMSSIEALRNVPVRGNGAKAILLRNLAEIRQATAVETFERYNMARTVSLTANLHDTDLGSVAAEVEDVLREVGAPPARTSVTVRGQTEVLRELTATFAVGLGAALVAILLVLAANFQSFASALVVLATFPAVLSGVVLALTATGSTLNIQSAIGTIMAVGVAVANGILFVTFAEQHRLRSGDAMDAALAGARDRLRPILMTSCAMGAGMLPMALGLGEGGAQTAPLGRAVLGGLVAATATTLFVLPCVYAILRRGASTASVSLDPDDPGSSHHSLRLHGPRNGPQEALS